MHSPQRDSASHLLDLPLTRLAQDLATAHYLRTLRRLSTSSRPT
jgi:hypothetical protein